MATDPTQLHQLSLLLGPDPTHFETLITHLMSSSNDQRSTAEFLFNLCKQTHPDSLLLRLTQLLSSSSVLDIRAMSAVLLRKHLTSATEDSFLYPQLTESTRSTIKNSLLSSLQHETTKSITRKINDTISELAASVLPDGGWQELLPFMFQCVTAQNDHNLQESALLIFARLAQYIGEALIPHLATLHGVFLNCLNNSTSGEVRIAALNATINFIQCLTNNSDREKFQDLLPLMMRTLTEALNGNQEATAQEALELLIELAGGEPRFLRKQIVEVVGSMLQIAEAGRLEEGTRHLAIEFVITLAEARDRAPGMMRKLPQFVHRLFMVLMGMLLDIDDDPQWHGAETEDEDSGETSNYGFGQECLDRLAIAIGGNTVVPVASEVFPAFLTAPEWQKPHAALIALAQIAEGCSKTAKGDDKEPGPAMPELLGSAKLAVEKDQSQGHNESYVKQLSDYIVPALVEALHKEPEVEICVSMLDSLTECIQGLCSGSFPLLENFPACARLIFPSFKYVCFGFFPSQWSVVFPLWEEEKDAVYVLEKVNIGLLDMHSFGAVWQLLSSGLANWINLSAIVPAWLSCLPIKSDLIEAKLVHDQLCSMVERSDRELFGSNNQYLPKIVLVFAEVICAGKELATEQTASRMINLLRQLQQMLPPATLASTWSSLEPQQQLALQSILSS
ncbi:hypothetical protein POTOM_044092 [Populus tomentosa]|uniref:Importin N-terminal domain-containing protein n=1 Tax=Populus tomentosa TaxID=118781 RepID=A0A8X8C7N2_POPTO|nr:hypothetical protein POTOM_044092 [Populus tomentosa]